MLLQYLLEDLEYEEVIGKTDKNIGKIRGSIVKMVSLGVPTMYISSRLTILRKWSRS